MLDTNFGPNLVKLNLKYQVGKLKCNTDTKNSLEWFDSIKHYNL